MFLSPEVLELPAWRKVLSNKTFNDRLAIVAVDEAPCIAEWLVVTLHVCTCIGQPICIRQLWVFCVGGKTSGHHLRR